MEKADPNHQQLTADRRRYRDVLRFPADIELELSAVNCSRELDLFELPHMKQLIEYQYDNQAVMFQRRLYEVEYAAQYNLQGRPCELIGNTWVLMPVEMLGPPVLQTQCTGSVRGIDEFLSDDYHADPDAYFAKSTEAMGAFFTSYYLQLPVHIICKRGPGVKASFSDVDDQHRLGQLWTRGRCECLAAAKAVAELGIALDPGRRFIGGVSQGGVLAHLLSAFTDDFSHCMAVSGLPRFATWTGTPVAARAPLYDHPAALEAGIDMPEMIALTRARTKVMVAMNDGEVRPDHFLTFHAANRIRRDRYGLSPLDLEVFHPEAGHRGHCWPRPEALTFFGNALCEGD